MKILFSNPPWWIGECDVQINNRSVPKWTSGIRAGSRWPHTNLVNSSPDNYIFGDYTPYPFFMGYAASTLQQFPELDVHLRDSIAIRESYESFFEYLMEEKFDLVFIESASPSWEHDGWLLFQIKKAYLGCEIVVTGPIATKAEEIMATHPIDACIKGEYEKGAIRIVQGERGVIDFDLLTLEEMNAAPFPYFDAQIALRYFDGEPHGQQAPQLQVWSSRGCPFKCIFCVWPAVMTGNDPVGDQPRSVRQYSADYMEAMLTELIAKYGYKTVYFDDDTFNLGNRHVEAMCDVMTRIGLPWSAMCRADTIRTDTWKIMRDAGCFGIKLGFESGDQWVLNNIVNKHLDLEVACDAVAEIKRLGMTIHGTFTMGLPGETKEQMQNTRDFIKVLALDSYQLSGTAEIEGTPLANLSKEETLDAYASATKADGYFKETNGSVKYLALVKQLQQN